MTELVKIEFHGDELECLRNDEGVWVSLRRVCEAVGMLKNARNCIYWTADEKGFMGLAVTGPGPKCKIGPAVPAIELRKITSVTEVTSEAAKAWEAAPFSK